jgi:AcrR family transcriptional regulator
MESVAARAGTGIAVLYRRWANKDALVFAALDHYREAHPVAMPDTGSLRGDVMALLTRMSTRLTKTGPEILYGLLGDYLSDPELFDRLRADVLQIGTEVTYTMLKRAAERGEARLDVSARVAALPTDLYRNELFLRRTPPDESTIAEIVDDVFLPLVRP